MKVYHVSYTIEIEATSYEAAAEQMWIHFASLDWGGVLKDRICFNIDQVEPATSDLPVSLWVKAGRVQE